MYVIPLTTDPNQSFTSVIPIDGDNRRLNIDLRYNEIAKYWCMTIHDPELRRVLIDSLPLLIGEFPVADLFQQYQHLGLGSATIVAVGPTEPNTNPCDETLGSSYVLAWGDTVDPDKVEAGVARE